MSTPIPEDQPRNFTALASRLYWEQAGDEPIFPRHNPALANAQIAAEIVLAAEHHKRHGCLPEWAR